MQTDNRQPTTEKLRVRRGFTLIEMLVATALVMLMMLLFAEVFGAAIGTITAQRGIANNDQKARSFTTILRHDLAGRTYRASLDRGATNEIYTGILESPRGIIPLSPGDVADPRQQGYLYLSENDTDDDTDDILQFTALVAPTADEAAPAPYFGRAASLSETTFDDNPNQPERDDGIGGNGASFSRAVEIAYFVRGGNLYRRVMLLRDPLPNDPTFDRQPTVGVDGTDGPFTQPARDPGPAGPGYFQQPYTFTGTSFYNDWDSSGTRIVTLDDGNGTFDPEGTDTYRFHFHSLESLDNSLGTTNTPLGFPWNRFGFYSRTFTSGGGANRPIEYLFDGAGNMISYIGRYTHEETSHALFDWPGVENGPPPGALPPPPNIMLRTDLVLSPEGVVAVDTNGSGLYDTGDTLLQGGRSGEDILLTNVEAFDIEVWDKGFIEDPNANGTPGFDPFDPQDDPNGNGVQDSGTWVDAGNTYSLGHYREAARANSTFGPGGPALPARNHVIDTWHPDSGIDADGNGAVDATELQRPPFRPLQHDPDALFGSYTHPTWPYTPNVGDVVFPYFGSSPGPQNFSIGFVAVRSSTGGTSGNTDPTEPTWTTTPGQTIADNQITWQCFDNRIGLERIRLTVRYRDVGTGQARQVTLVHSLVD